MSDPFRSFGPILRLLLVEHTPVVQHWAVWALANLCTVSRKFHSPFWVFVSENVAISRHVDAFATLFLLCFILILSP